MAVELQVEVPNVSECAFTHNVILSELSSAAANASIYVLVNVVEMEMCNETEMETDDACEIGYKLFNTNLVFDRNGCVISRYRKFNLFGERFMNVTKTPDISTFETDFGVTFGHFICFDILFKSPALDLINMGIRHILYPSMWFSEIPFLASIQIQQSFAQRNNIALISAGTNFPSHASTGSGIFIGRHGAVDKIISCENESRMLIAEVPKNVDDVDYEPSAPSVEPYTPDEMKGLSLWQFTPKNTFPLADKFSYSMENITCEFSINYTSIETADNETADCYKLVVFSGTRSYAGIVNAGEVHCAIVPEYKKGEKFEPCVEFHDIHIKLAVHDTPEDYLVMPTSLDTSILPLATLDYTFEIDNDSENQKYSLKATQEISDLMTFGIYGRHYSLDSKAIKNDEMETFQDLSKIASSGNEDIDEDNNLALKMTIYGIFMVGVGILTAIMVRRRLRHPYMRPDSIKRKSVS